MVPEAYQTLDYVTTMPDIYERKEMQLQLDFRRL